MRLALACLMVVAGCNDVPPAKAENAPAPPTVPATPPPFEEPPPAAAEGPPVRDDGTIFGSATLMGTSVSINVFLDKGKTAAVAGAAMQSALDEMARIEEIMSEWRPDSELSKLNAAAGGGAKPASRELIEVLDRAHVVSDATDGAFDITFHGVGQLWSFKPGAVPPTRKAVAAKLPLVDWRTVKVDSGKRTIEISKAGVMVGLGAIAKGYAVDRASTLLNTRGFPNHVVEAGGDTFAAGTKDGKPWMVGVQDPDDGKNALGALPTTNKAVVTSGDYQRFLEHEGKRYAHIIDPRTGWPIEQATSPKSVTLVAANATDADAYCTAVTVMGPDKGMAFVEGRDDLDAVIIDRAGKVRVSSGLKDVYQPR